MSALQWIGMAEFVVATIIGMATMARFEEAFKATCARHVFVDLGEALFWVFTASMALCLFTIFSFAVLLLADKDGIFTADNTAVFGAITIALHALYHCYMAREHKGERGCFREF